MIRYFLVLPFVSTAFAQYSVSVIPLPSGTFWGEMIGINSSGQVTGYNNSSCQAFLGGLSGSVLIPLPPGSSCAYGASVNDAGTIAGSFPNPDGSFVGSVSGSSTIPLPSGSSSFAVAVNNGGKVAGTFFNPNNPQGFIGTAEGYSLVPLPNGAIPIVVMGMNDYDQVTGSANIGAPGPTPFIGTIGTNAASTLIPMPSGWRSAYGVCINNSAQIAGTGGLLAGATLAFIGTAAASTAIPLPPGATNVALNYGCLNNSGQMVGWSDAGGWIWDSVNGTRLLNSMVPAGWNIQSGLSISNNGLILGYGTFNGGTSLSVELTPLPSSGCTYTITPPAAFFSANAAGGAINVSTQPGCAWTASSDSSWLVIGSATSGSGSGGVSFQMNSNTSSPNRVGIVTLGGKTFPVTQDAANTVSSLAPLGVAPGAGSSMTQTFTFTFTDQAGAGDLNVLDVLINNYLDGQQACYFALVPSGLNSGYLYLVDDAGDRGYVSGTPMLLSSNGTLQNNQCSISATGSSITAIGNNLTLVLTINFKSGFAGSKIFYIAARSNTQNSGWQAQGTWNVPGVTPSGPAVGGIAPSRITTATYGVGYNNYTFTFTDTNGFADIGVVDILINSFLDGVAACYIAYVPASATTGFLYLVDDAGDGGYVSGAPVLLASAPDLSNQQCSISSLQGSASASGNTLTLNLPISFSFKGNQVVYMAARNNNGGNSGWQAVGSITIP